MDEKLPRNHPPVFGHYFCWMLAAIPFMCLLGAVFIYKVDMPSLDDWALAPLIDKSFQGTLSLHDFFVQHNEHRIFFPRIIILLLVRLSDWSITYELAANILCAIGIFFALVYQVGITKKHREDGAHWLIPIISLMVFSLTQWENWLWGFQLVVFMCVCAIVAGIILLSNMGSKRLWFLAALFSGIIATYSFANGMLYWPIGFLVLMFSPVNGRRTKNKYMLVWVLTAAATVLLYFYGYHKPEHHPSLWVIYEYPLEYSTYVFSFLGSPVTSQYAFSAGLLGSVLMVTAWLVLLRSQRITVQMLIPYLALSLYSFASAAIIGIGRAGWGDLQALNSRYVTHAYLFWIANIVFLYLLITSHGLYNRFLKYLSICTIIVITMLTAYNSLYSMYSFQEQHNRLMKNRDMLLSFKNRDPQHDWSEGYVYKKGVEIIKRRHLSVFRNDAH